MAFYYYIKKGGLAVGDAGRSATARTGTWNASAADYYDSLYDVFAGGVPTTAPTSGDAILCSSAHSKGYASTTALGLTDGVIIISVDNANQENYLKGAIEAVTATNGIFDIVNTVAVSVVMFGVLIKCHRYLKPLTAAEAVLITFNCDFYITGGSSGYFLAATGDGALGIYNNADFYTAGAGTFFSASAGGRFIWNGGVLQDSVTTLVKSGGNGGVNVELVNVDLTKVTGSITDLITASNSDRIEIDLSRCLMASAVPLTSGTWAQKSSRVEAKGLGVGTGADDYHYFESEFYEGGFSEDTAIYRTLGATYDGTNNFSSDIISNGNCSYSHPIKFDLGSQFIDTADYTTNVTFTVHFAVDGSTVALNSDEFWMEVEHVDGADNALGVLVDNKAAPLATGTAPTTETSLWTGLGGTNKQMSISKTITIGTTAGTIASGLVRVSVYLGKASQAVFVCPQAEGS